MKAPSTGLQFRAFALMDLVLTVAVVILLVSLALMAIPAGTHCGPKATTVRCTNNLKQIGLAFYIWKTDHSGKFPMEISTTNGGTMEFVSGMNTFRHFQVMSNELSTPKLLFCPTETDSFRKEANTFGPPGSGTPRSIPFSGNHNVSYFVGLDATPSKPSAFLSGDRNITNGTVLRSGVLELTTNRPSSWTTAMHEKRGNVGLADGSVQGWSSSILQQAVPETGIATNRLSMP